MTRLVLVLCASLLSLSLSGCGDVGCLKTSDPSCRMPSPCKKLSYACAADGASVLEVHLLDSQSVVPGGEAALGARGDVLIGNERVVAVIAGLGDQNFLDLSGGSILDLQPRGRDADALNQLTTVVGVLPRDSAYYTSMQLIDERPTRVAVQLRGTLYQQPDTTIVTLYEVRPCEPGVRVRSVLLNGTPDPQAWTLGDGWYWSGREPIPFTPGKGRGFVHPPVDLLTVNDIIEAAPYLAASSHVGPGVSYAELGCEERTLEGFHSEQVSTFGTHRAIVPTRGIVTFERFVLTADRGDVASAIDLALEARSQLFAEQFVTLTGRVEVPTPAGGTLSERDISLLVSEGDAATPASERSPTTQILPHPDGTFSARVPTGRHYVVAVHAFGRKVNELALGLVGADRDLGVLQTPSVGRLRVTVTDATAVPLDAEVFVVPSDEATRASVAGSFHGALQACAPWLGPSAGASPACNRFLVWHATVGPTDVQLPFGHYDVYAYHGPFFTLAHQAIDVTGGDLPLELQLRSLGLQPQGTVSGDFHIHGAASFDSSIPDWDRVLSFAAAQLQVAIATDHDVVSDYADMARQLGIDGYVSTVSGVETTGHMPFLKIPGSDFPLVIGHYNFWPLRFAPTEPRNGGPFDELVEPGELFDRTEPLFTGLPMIELNHPWAEPEAGRDLGFPRALSLDTLVDLPTEDDGSAAGIFIKTPIGGHANDAHHAQEVMNGSQNDILLQYRAFWWYLLNQGKPKTGTANSDSHGLADTNIGSPRNVVYTDTFAGPHFNLDRFDEAVRQGRSFGTNGPIIEAAIIDARGGGPEVELPYGMNVLTPTDNARLRVVVSAAPWVPVDEVRLIVNGTQVMLIGKGELASPGDPFGTIGLMRLTKEIPLSQLLTGVRGDAWIVIEAGTALPIAADLGGGLDNEKDGIPDTGDNNGDGVVDVRDIEAGKLYGPLKLPAAPAPGSPLYPFYQVVGGYPMSFTNPFLLDRDGNGKFDRIGVGGGR